MATRPLAAVAEEIPLAPFQVCRALTDFNGQQEGDLSFRKDEQITIIAPSEVLFWYKAKNTLGQEGLVPRTFLEVSDGGRPQFHVQCEEHESNYLPMKSATNQSTSHLSQQQNDPVHKEMLRIQEKEKRGRLPAGTLVIGTCQFAGGNFEDLPFSVYEEMSILYPLQDLCWYYAQKTDHPEQMGNIPVTHVRLVYMSDDDDDDDEITYNAPSKPAHDRLYDDINEFVRQSGWFSHPGLAHGKIALQHVLARKAGLSYERFISIQQAVYLLNYRHGEKVYVGFANILKDEMCKHFASFGKNRGDITDIDDELCHHTECSEWEITVWPLQTNDTEFEWAKKVIELKSLTSRETQKGLNEKLCFTTMQSFDKLWDWFSPN